MRSESAARNPPAPPPGIAPDSLERAAREHFQFIWRCLRRLGIQPEHAVDDAAQRVFEIAAHKRVQILPGSERAFLFRTAVLVAAEERRAQRRALRHETDEEALNRLVSELPTPDQAAEAKHWRERLDWVLQALPVDLRTVFVLFEFEKLSTPEIAELLELAPGTVASRLRRARLEFQAAAKRLRAQLDFKGESK